ncbi:hypothetical protein N7510_000114 [Penicillium lagena]|uniref:uncharacterized protein n=1 Tax=Penicillium lagena TaxID=94218 RepID=UPI002541743D|nr:uncharacterized protein N7510_000114 [Penicillium lagena]KAJ5623805.1 hypothetical protein N7510_000114 [Penicillium lagena]
MELYLHLFILTGVVIFLATLRAWLTPRKLFPLPPGPKGKPIIGNLLDLPAAGKQEWQHWLKHKDLYGPLSSITIFGQTIIVINDRQLASRILDKNSAKHSSRPISIFANEL